MTLKETAVTVAIAILFSAFILVAIDAFYPRPEYNQFCTNEPYATYAKQAMPTPTNCTYIQNEDELKCNKEGGFANTTLDSGGCTAYSGCNFCNKELAKATEVYNNRVFLILAPIGILAILFGVSYAIEFLGSGFMFAGIILMFWGTVQNFQGLNKFMRVAVVFIELLLVMFIAYKKIINKKETKRQEP